MPHLDSPVYAPSTTTTTTAGPSPNIDRLIINEDVLFSPSRRQTNAHTHTQSSSCVYVCLCAFIASCNDALCIRTVRKIFLHMQKKQEVHSKLLGAQDKALVSLSS